MIKYIKVGEKMEWTEEQEKAIKTKKCNLLVSAGAGSGKTAVLVERIVSMVLEDKIDITNILVVTFTNAAASEMKERILDKLYEKLDKNPEDIWLQKQVINIGSANITTIHSFCLSVIKQYYYEIGIEPNLKIANEIDNQLMKYEILQEMFDEQYEKENADIEFLNLLEMYDEKNEHDNLKDIILKIYGFIQNQPFADKVYESLFENLNEETLQNFESTYLGKEYISQIVYDIREIIVQLDKILDIVAGDDKQTDFFEAKKMQAIELLDMQDKKWDEIVTLLNTFELGRRPQLRGYDEKTSNAVKAHWENIKGLKEQIGISITQNDIVAQMEVNKKEMTYLINMVKEFEKRFKDKKQKNKVLDFNDFEHYALKILLSIDDEGNAIPTDVAKEYRKKFHEILIDEYQDSNYVQDYILNAISKCDEGNPNIFMVGDVKQSIYKFRGAQPKIFLDKYYTYSLNDDSKYRKINLYKNFRSRDVILEYINYIFSKIMTNELGDIEYTKDEYLNYGANYEKICTNNSNIELTVITPFDNKTEQIVEESVEEQENEILDDEQQEEKIAIEKIEYEAQFVANRIENLINEKYTVFDKKTKEYREIRYSDIVILLRNTKGKSTIFGEVFKKNNIPIYVDNKVGYLDELEVSEVLSFLQIIDNPYQDIPLLSVLKSPFGNFNDNEIFEIRQYDKQGYFYTAMQKASVTDEKVSKFLTRLNKYMEESKYLTVSKLIWNIYEEYNYIQYMRKYKDYESKKANLLLLFERARQFEDSSYKGLFNFINFIFRIKDSKEDMGSATILGENDNVVRLMSIHKSKGLEFPVVFLCNVNAKFNFKDTQSKLLLDQELLMGNEIIDIDKRISYPSISKRIIANKMKKEIIAEEMRMLYVALTRAREKLIITGVSENIDNLILKSKTATMDNLNSYLSFIAYAVFNNDYTKNLDIKYVTYLDIEKGMTIKKEDIDSGDKEENISLKDICNNNLSLIEKQDFDNEKYIDISKQMSYEYSNSYLQTLPHKISVSEIKKMENEKNMKKDLESESQEKDKIIDNKWLDNILSKNRDNIKDITPTERGNIYHYIFQNLDFSKKYTLETLKSEILAMNKITDREYSVIDINKILDFTNSKLYEQIQSADMVYREKTFMLQIDYEDIKEIFGVEEIKEEDNTKMLVQGTIDMFYIKDREAVIVDYKTDRVKDVEEIKKRYEVQLKYYKKAIEKMLGIKVKNTYIYLVTYNKVIEME